MNIVGMAKATFPYVKKFGPIIVAGVGAVAQAASEQKNLAKVASMEKRIADLEKLLRK
jgi:hypothetical protein